MKIKSLILCLTAIILLNNDLWAQKTTLPEGIKKTTTVEGISEYELKNGLKVLLFPDPSKPTVTVNITYLVGSRHEGYGETGMAHLLEHLVFKGTPNHPDIPQELTEHGARPNGTTWYDRTNYFETFSASDENLDWALDLEADRMINSYIAQKDLDSEMTVVRNEFESGENSPSRVLLKRTLSAAFQWHNYGNSTIGARADIENVPIENLQAFYRKYYQPDNAVLTVAGKIDIDKTLALIAKKFGPIPRPERKLIPTFTKEPTQDGERLVTLRRTGDVQALSCVYHVPPGPHADYAAVAVIEELLTNEPAGRLYKSMVESKQASYLWGFAPGLKEGGFLYIGADVRKENSIEDAKNTLIKTMDDLKKNPPTEEEVERAKARILKNWELGYNNSDRVGRTMSEYIAQGDWRLFFLFRDNIEAVKPEDVVKAAQTYFKPTNRTIGMFIPEKDSERVEIPDAPDLEALVANYKGRAAISEGEAFDPSPKNIESRTERGEMASGLEFALLPKETRGDAVQMRMTFRFGDEKTLVGKGTAGELVAQMLNKGTTKQDKQAIQDKLDQLKAQVYFFGGSRSLTAIIETTHDNLPEVIKLTSEMIKTPAFDEAEFAILKEEQLSFTEEQMSDPRALASKRFNRLLNPYPKENVRYQMTMEEELTALKAATLDDVTSFYKEFYGASDATMAAVGDFDKKAVQKLLEAEFGDWKSPTKYQRITDPYIEAKPANENINTPDKANAGFYAGMNLPIGDSHPDYAALTLGNYILGGGFLNSRLATRIRRTDGLSYGVGSWFYASSQDESGGFGAYAIYAPENAKKLEKAFREEIEKVVNDGFTTEEMDAAKSGWLQSREVTRAQDRSLARSLNNYLNIDRDLMWDAKMEEKIKNLTVEDINKAMAKHLDLDKMIFIKAGDFERVAKDMKP